MTWKVICSFGKSYFSGVKRTEARMQWSEVEVEGKDVEKVNTIDSFRETVVKRKRGHLLMGDVESRGLFWFDV